MTDGIVTTGETTMTDGNESVEKNGTKEGEIKTVDAGVVARAADNCQI